MKCNNKVLIILSFFSIYFIWGSTYLLNKIAVTELPPFMLVSFRFILAGILIFIISKFLKFKLSITLKQFLNASIAGFLFLAFGNGVIVWALKYVDSGFAALEISAQPLIVILLMRFIEGKRIQSMSVIGVVLGIIGIYLLISQKQLISQEGMLTGMVMIFVCMISWAYGSLFVSKADLPPNFFVNTGYQMISGGVMLLFASLLFKEQWIPITDWSNKVQFSMIALIIGGIVAFTSFNYLLRTVSPEKVATSTYVNPVIALLLGWYFLNEQITFQSIIAAIVLLTGVYFINTKKKLVVYSRFKK
ncbi:drug/metabolite transporter (DMT)-like permease [Lutibacter oceani]|uniref:Drug/metabolite transporter (DMT)-like permease n=1 Tax=Lutibacter oceani TaxID=1853311 RepID=A0A3D9RPG7_9FLAO|nr:EamA family transporter [Lutibacter oceani]REE81697.1 drug/metabolite transporter (DMT)-like permease [Lutibacter oceani]